MGKKPFKILFVCLGNICRSPAAQGVMQHLIDENGLHNQIELDSAGLYSGHAGELPDRRMRTHAFVRGYRLEHISRPVNSTDFDEFDMIIGMDDSNISSLKSLAPDPESEKKIHRMTEFCRFHPKYDHIPDPYYEGAEGFELVLDLLEDGCQGLLDTFTT